MGLLTESLCRFHQLFIHTMSKLSLLFCFTSSSMLTVHISSLISLLVVSAQSNHPPQGTRYTELFSTIPKAKQEARN